MSELIKIPRQVNPECILPEDLNTPVWRYMEMYKFESLLNKRALYLRRADLLEDSHEGTYSLHQIATMEKWFKEIGEEHMIDSERKSRERLRRNSFLSCWCKYEHDHDLMWKAYVGDNPGVVVRSSVRKLKAACDSVSAIELWSQSLDISEVKYFDHSGGKNINYFGTPSVFFHKDYHFQLDNELRIVHYRNYGDQQIPDHVFLPTTLPELIDFVVMKPNANENDLKSVEKLLRNADLSNLPVFTSRYNRKVK